jgi:hypothetical protein
VEEEVRKGRWYLKELERLFAEMDHDLNYVPPQTNKALRPFVECDQPLEEHDANEVVEDVKLLWPEVEHVSADKIILLKQAMNGADCSSNIDCFGLFSQKRATDSTSISQKQDRRGEPTVRATNDDAIAADNNAEKDVNIGGALQKVVEPAEASDDTVELVEAALNNVIRCMPLEESTLTISASNQCALLAALRNKLVEVRRDYILSSSTSIIRLLISNF